MDKLIDLIAWFVLLGGIPAALMTLMLLVILFTDPPEGQGGMAMLAVFLLLAAYLFFAVGKFALPRMEALGAKEHQERTLIIPKGATQ